MKKENLRNILLATGLVIGAGAVTVAESHSAKLVPAQTAPCSPEGDVTTALEGITVYEETAVTSPTDPHVVAFQASDKAHHEPVMVIKKDCKPSAVIRHAYYPRWQSQPGSGLEADLAFTSGLMRGESPEIVIYNPYRNEVAGRMTFFPGNNVTAGWEGSEFVQRQGTQRRAVSDPNPTAIKI
jgi:hypothetical protein